MSRKLSGLLGVRYLLQGSVRRDGGHVRIAAQLVDDSGAQVWSNAYDRELRGIFAIQREIAGCPVANQTDCGSKNRGAVASRARAAAERRGLSTLSGRASGSSTGACRAMGCTAEEQFRKAVAIDPNYAEALAELAILWAFDPGTAQQAEKAIERAQQAEKAIERALVPEARSRTGGCRRQGLLLLEARRPAGPPWGRSSVPPGADARSEHWWTQSTWLAGLLADQGRHAERLSILGARRPHRPARARAHDKSRRCLC